MAAKTTQDAVQFDEVMALQVEERMLANAQVAALDIGGLVV